MNPIFSKIPQIILANDYHEYFINLEPANKYTAFLDLIFMADPQTGRIKTSLRELSIRWSWSIKKVRVYLAFLEKQNLAKRERASTRTNKGQLDGTKQGIEKGTLLTVDNYGQFTTIRNEMGHKTVTKQVTKQVTSEVTDKGIKQPTKTDQNSLIQYAEFVNLKLTEYQKLVTQHGEAAAQRMIEILNLYKGANGKTYKSDYMAILNWVVKRYQEEQGNGQNQPSQMAKSNPREKDYTTFKW